MNPTGKLDAQGRCVVEVGQFTLIFIKKGRKPHCFSRFSQSGGSGRHIVPDEEFNAALAVARKLLFPVTKTGVWRRHIEYTQSPED
jgi:hypothetical protein